ncbi:MAG: hypothetical protein M1838_005271 [Thelocarpon superellum]|nr:MAG: hypothetical protein M1838_005271 [Thelocarpon superellum]
MSSPHTVLTPMPPPPGVQPNFDHPDSSVHQIVATSIICLIISGLCVSLRLYSKAILTRSLGWDDYTSVIAMGFSIANSVTEWQLINFGMGVHLWDVPLTTFSPYFLAMRAANTAIYASTMFFVKFSILLMYLRIFTTNRFIKYSSYFLIIYTAGYGFPGALTSIFGCRPLAKGWDVHIKTGYCVNFAHLAVAANVLNIVGDFFIFLLPLPAIWHLHLPIRQRFAVMAVFVVGLFVCIISALRLSELIRNLDNPDVTWVTLTLNIWNTVEINLGIACGCAPAMKPLFKYLDPRSSLLDPRSWGSKQSGKGSSTDQSGSSGSKPVKSGGYSDRWASRAKPQRTQSTLPSTDTADTDRHSQGPYMELGSLHQKSNGGSHVSEVAVASTDDIHPLTLVRNGQDGM